MDLNYCSYYPQSNTACRPDLTYRGHWIEIKTDSEKMRETYIGHEYFHFLICSICMLYGIKTLPKRS